MFAIVVRTGSAHISTWRVFALNLPCLSANSCSHLEQSVFARPVWQLRSATLGVLCTVLWKYHPSIPVCLSLVTLTRASFFQCQVREAAGWILVWEIGSIIWHRIEPTIAAWSSSQGCPTVIRDVLVKRLTGANLLMTTLGFATHLHTSK